MSRSSVRWLSSLSLAVLLLILCFPGWAQQITYARSGILVCGGNYWTDEQETEAHLSSFEFFNAGDHKILIERIVVTDANGEVRCDYPEVDTLPEDFNSALLARQNTTLRVRDMESCSVPVLPLPSEERPLQVRVSWKSESFVRTPELVGVTTFRTRSLTDRGATMAKDNARCLTVMTVR